MTDAAGSQDPVPGRWASRQTRAFAATVLAPLGEEEAERAVLLARELVLGAGAGADRIRVFPPRVRVEKPARRDGAPRRLVWVRVRDAERRVVHEVAVSQGEVVDHVVNEAGDPPLTLEEADLARSLLASDPRFGELLNDPTVEIEWFNPGHGAERLLGARLVRVEANLVVEVLDQATADLDNNRLIVGGEHGG